MGASVLVSRYWGMKQAEPERAETPELPSHKEKGKSAGATVRKRNKFSINVLKRLGIDTSNLPDGATLIHRKDKRTGDDVWIAQDTIHSRED